MNAVEQIQQPALSVLRSDIQALRGYAVASAEGLVKLDAMENPFTLPASITTALGQRLSQVALNRYPPADPTFFKAKLAEAMGLAVQGPLKLMLGNGSDELIHLLIQACARPGAVVLSPWPSFAMYELSAQFDGCRFIAVPLNTDFSLNSAALIEAINTYRPTLVFLAWPNNPSGNLFERTQVQAVLDAVTETEGLLVIDEAYLPFAQDTWLPQLNSQPQLLVLRTLSKLGLAGIRLGYLCGHQVWIEQLEKLRPPYNVNSLTLAAADFMLDHLALLDEQAAQLRAERPHLLKALRALPQITAFDSAANFILFRVPQAAAVFARLKQQGILIKNLSTAHPLLADCLRVTIGTPHENQQFLTALRTAME